MKQQTPLFEAVVPNPWDAQYQAVIKDFIALKDPGTKVGGGVSSAINEKSIERNGIQWTISFHKPDSKWGNSWNFMELFATRIADRKTAFDAPALKKFTKEDMSKLKHDDPVMSTFMKTSGRFYAKDHPETQAWQKRNLDTFKAAVQFIKGYDEKRDKLFESTLKESSGSLRDYMNPGKDLMNGEALKLGAKDLQTNLTTAFNQLSQTVIRVMADQSDLQAPGLFDGFMNDLKKKTAELQNTINTEYRQLKNK